MTVLPFMVLYPFQREGIKKMMHFLNTNEAHACYNASSMGTGKTLMTLETIKGMHFKRIVILCPAILRLVWLDEIKKWYPEGTVEIWLQGSQAEQYQLSGTNSNIQWSICSYDLAHRDKLLDYLSVQTWDCLVLDEAHYVKQKHAKRTRAALGNIWAKAKHRILLSGTPFTTCVTDGFTAFTKCAPTLFPSFDKFTEEYCYKRWVPWGRKHTEYYGLKNHQKLSELIRNSFYLRYKKEDVLTELPPKTFQRIPLANKYAVVCKSKNENTQLQFEADKIAEAIRTGKVTPVPKSLAEHRRLQGEAKVPPIADFVTDLLEQQIPVVLYGWHKNVIAALSKELIRFNPVVVTGETPAAARHAAVEAFQSGKTDLFIGNMVAAGVGITLTRSSTIVMAELDWSPAVVSQSIDRLHRIGQKDSVTVYYFEVVNSLDSIIVSVVMNRVRQFSLVLDSKETHGEPVRK